MLLYALTHPIPKIPSGPCLNRLVAPTHNESVLPSTLRIGENVNSIVLTPNPRVGLDGIGDSGRFVTSDLPIPIRGCPGGTGMDVQMTNLIHRLSLSESSVSRSPLVSVVWRGRKSSLMQFLLILLSFTSCSACNVELGRHHLPVV